MAERARAEKDYLKSFRSRPGSADWKPHCTCGWVGSKWMYKTEAEETAERHMRRAHGGKP